jgi:hypothetical protein
MIWAVLKAEGIFTRSRRGKALLSQAERCAARAAYYRNELRNRQYVKNVTPQSPGEWLEQQRSVDGG